MLECVNDNNEQLILIKLVVFMYDFLVWSITILPVSVKGEFRTLANAANYTLLAADGGCVNQNDFLRASVRCRYTNPDDANSV